MGRLVPLGSGSRGNATFVELAGTRLLVDAGLSARRLAQALDELSVEPESLNGILVSHEHQDHARGAERFSKKHGVPVLCARETLLALDCAPSHFAAWQPLVAGQVQWVDGVALDAFPIPHDAASPVGFTLSAGGAKVGIVTDLGHATTLVRQRLRGCTVLMVEANHDETMLRDGPYPWQLKQRVASRLGHLSNREAARLVEQSIDESCHTVVLGHLSEQNNDPGLSRDVVTKALVQAGRGNVEVRVAATRATTRPVIFEESEG